MADELARRLVHASGAVVPGAYLVNEAFVGWPYLAWDPYVHYVLYFGVVATVALEFARLVVGIDWVVFDKLTREYEQDNPAGYALYVFSGSVTGLVFEPTVAIPAILMLTLADPVSGALSADELRTVKRPHVLVVMFALCTAIAAAFVSLPAAVLGGLAAMLADGVKPVVAGYVVDDNLTIPLVAAGAMAAGLAYLPAVGL